MSGPFGPHRAYAPGNTMLPLGPLTGRLPLVLWVITEGATGTWQRPLRPTDRVELRRVPDMATVVEISGELLMTIIGHYFAGHQLMQMMSDGAPPNGHAPAKTPIVRKPLAPRAARIYDPARLARLHRQRTSRTRRDTP